MLFLFCCLFDRVWVGNKFVRKKNHNINLACRIDIYHYFIYRKGGAEIIFQKVLSINICYNTMDAILGRITRRKYHKPSARRHA